jgi:hypothetical protein
MIDERFLRTIPQYGIGGFVKKIFKKVKDTVKKVAPIAGAGIGFLIGGAAGAGIGSGIGSLIAGKSAGESLQNAMLGYGIGSLAGITPGLKGFAGKGIGGNFAWDPADKGNLFNLFKGATPEGKIANIDSQINTIANSDLAYTQAGADRIKALTNAKDQLEIQKILGGGGLNTGGGGMLGNALMAGSLAMPGLAYWDAQQAQRDWEPTDQMKLNELYYQDPQAFQLAGLGVKPYYHEDLQDYYGMPIQDLPTDFIRSAKGGPVRRRKSGTDLHGERVNENIIIEENTPVPQIPYREMLDNQMMGYLMMMFEQNPSDFQHRFGKQVTETIRQLMGYRTQADMERDTGAIFDDQTSEIVGYNLAQGGTVKLANGSEQYFPRKNGEIEGPGTGTSDDIPAMLSDGEFVFTARAVNNAGDGDRREGAKRMYQVMKNLEKGGRLSNQTRGVAA